MHCLINSLCIVNRTPVPQNQTATPNKSTEAEQKDILLKPDDKSKNSKLKSVQNIVEDIVEWLISAKLTSFGAMFHNFLYWILFCIGPALIILCFRTEEGNYFKKFI